MLDNSRQSHLLADGRGQSLGVGAGQGRWCRETGSYQQGRRRPVVAAGADRGRWVRGRYPTRNHGFEDGEQAFGTLVRKNQGGKILNGPMEVPGNDVIAQCQDPQGAAFAIYAEGKK